jgi:mannitol-1-phosphate 5-dehydrogenase
MKKLVLFGAGKIGRSFIGQLFSASGYEIVFVDVFEPVIHELNRRHQYDVIIKSNQPDEVIRVKNVCGILGTEMDKVAEQLSECDIAAVCVGQKGLPGVIPVLAKGLMLRMKKGKPPLDIILAENMRDADQYVRNLLRLATGNGFKIDKLAGLVETSIGKMVPIMPQEEQKKDILRVYAESYNTLILDKKGFKNPIPQVKGLAPKENMKAWVDRKSYIHNFGHAAAAYAGFLVDPSVTFLADVLKIEAVKKFSRNAMIQSAGILMKKYPGEFTHDDLIAHIDDLLKRFENRALGDTVFRVGCDLKRKLNKNDRILSPLRDGIRLKSPVKPILQTFAYALCFRGRDEYGQMFPDDVDFKDALENKGLAHILVHICGLNPDQDRKVIERILSASWNDSPLKLTLGRMYR